MDIQQLKQTKRDAAIFFNISLKRISEQYADNAKGIETMLLKAIKTGKKVNGYTAEQLKELLKKFQFLATC